MTTLGTTTIDLSTAVNGLKVQSFGGSEFQNATGFATLTGPLALVIDFNNQSDFALYIGLKVYTLEGAITISDRRTIAFSPSKTQVTISGASVPQLARIDGIITQIDVQVYVLPAQAGHGGATTNPTVAIRILAPALISAPQPIIGKDTQAYAPGNLVLVSGETNVAIGGTNVTIATTGAVSAYGRLRIHSVDIWVKNAALGTGLVKAIIIDPNAVSFPYAYVVCNNNEYVTKHSTPSELILPANWSMQIIATNGTGALMGAYGSIVGEYLL